MSLVLLNRAFAIEKASMKVLLTLKVNGEDARGPRPGHKTLLEVLREELDLTGTKHGCELGECGTCTVLVDGEPVLSCLALPVECQGREITTVEGMAERRPAAPAAAGLRGAGRRPVRLLHAGHPAHRRGAAGGQPGADARRDRARPSPATSAAAPATSRSSRPSSWPPCACSGGRGAQRPRKEARA